MSYSVEIIEAHDKIVDYGIILAKFVKSHSHILNPETHLYRIEYGEQYQCSYQQSDGNYRQGQ